MESNAIVIRFWIKSRIERDKASSQIHPDEIREVHKFLNAFSKQTRVMHIHRWQDERREAVAILLNEYKFF